MCVEETKRRAEQQDRMEARAREQRQADIRKRREEADRTRGWYEGMLESIKAEALRRFKRDLYHLTAAERFSIPHCAEYYHPAGTCSGLLQDADGQPWPCRWAEECRHVAARKMEPADAGRKDQ